jgi:release factor glutamine methyltransferase
MNIKEVFKKYSFPETELLLAYVLKKPKEFLFMNPEYNLTKKQLSNLTKLIKRRQNGEPIAYILGYKDFCGLRFKVNKNVLVPRPDTESLVEFIENRVRSQKLGIKSQELSILDVGTGSGCIAITLAKRCQVSGVRCKVYASDISSNALTVAKENAKKHQVKIKFIHSNLLEKINFIPNILIANLPYGWSKWKNNTSTETLGLKFEPKIALFTKENGLFKIHKLLKQILSLPHLPKYIYLEFDPRQKVLLNSLIKKYLPNGEVKFYKDLSKKWRFVEIKN